MKKRLTFLCLTFLLAMGCQPNNSMNPYGAKVSFKQDQELPFPDFTIRYVGKSKVIPPMYPRGFIYENFILKTDAGEEKVRWSSGTGSISPADLTVGGKTYFMELKISDVIGPLREDELVVWREEDWHQQMKARTTR